jgi:ABC-2 type transport system ATP-binding protein
MDRVDQVRRAFAAYQAGDIAGAGSLFADNAVWPAADPAGMGCKNRRDIEEMLARVGDSGAAGDIQDLVAVGNAVVAAFRSPDARAAGESRGTIYWVLGFDGSQVVRADSFPERASALHAAGQPAQPGEVVLAVDSVAKRFRRAVALSGVSLTVRSGEAVAIIGENGAGKSTLLRLCAGLDRPDEGTIQRPARVGYCPQEPALFDLLTAEEHLALFGAGRPISAVAAGRELLAVLGFRAGPRTPVRDLSGGARQKLNLALALLGQPELLLLDEPYQGFDYGSYLDFWGLVDGWRIEGKAVVVVTHMLTELHRVDHVVELRRAPGDG